jgi:hypothetical protein
MPTCLTLAPTADDRVFLDEKGARHSPPVDWSCLPPGDAGLTRRVKAAGDSWVVVEKRGLWASAAVIAAARQQLDAERDTPEYAKKRASDVARRERSQAEYVVEFEAEVLRFLRFHPRYEAQCCTLARRVAEHATPVGSGTVARTRRITVDQRAEAAVVAWMRHQTTAYDSMTIARVKGERREVRRELAQISRAVLDLHRVERTHLPGACSLCQALG